MLNKKGLVLPIIWLFLMLIQSCFNNIINHDNPMLLLVSFDGFRWDYLNMYNLTNFRKLRDSGSHAEYIKNSFSTVTFPNHWTIVTGLYEESHGIIQNLIYDPVLNKTFNYKSAESQTIEWYGQNKIAEPIWTTNQKAGQNRRSAAEWIGANIVFQDQNITYIPYNKSRTYKELIDQFINLFRDKYEPINFGALYFDEPDHVGHLYGPYSEEMKSKLDELDQELGYMLNQLKAHNLLDKLNLIVTSDHGMDTISSKTAIFLDTYIDTSLFEAYGSRACYSIFIKKESDLEYVYETLKNIPNIDIYKKKDIPENFNYKNNVRIGDVLLVTKIGYAVYINKQPVNWTINNGDHGYDNNESSMHPIFIAHGPAFRKMFKTKPFNNVDIYPLMCSILGVHPAANNGSILNVEEMLVKSQTRIVIIYIIILSTPFLSASITALFLCFMNKKNNIKLDDQSTLIEKSTIINFGSQLNLDISIEDENVGFINRFEWKRRSV